ncbi:MAG: glycosyltransferase [Bacteroidales bacterium]
MELSIILPVYNVADYLPRCLESIHSQQLPEEGYEIIAVDDGSTDDSAAVLKRLQKEVTNLNVIRQLNSGPSVARNTALQYASGRYIFFVDPDDYLAPGALKKLYDHLTLQGDEAEDIVGFRYMKVDETGHVTPYHSQKFQYGRHFTGSHFLQEHNVIGVVWAYLFRREFLIDKALKMIPGIFHQDEEFVVRAFFFANRVILLDLLLYYYFKRTASTVNRPERAHRERLIRDTMTAVASLTTLRDTSEEAHRVMERKLSYLCVDVIRLLIREQHSSVFIREILSRMHTLELYPLAEHNYGVRYNLFCRVVNAPWRILLLKRIDPRYFPLKRVI